MSIKTPMSTPMDLEDDPIKVTNKSKIMPGEIDFDLPPKSDNDNIDKMFIIFKADAKQIYIDECTHSGRFIGNWEWAKKLEQLQNQKVEVDTDYLWQNAFNMKIKPYISKDGLNTVTCMHIDEDCIETVINDKRIGRGICKYCHNHGPVDQGCPNNHDNKWFEPFDK